MATMEFNNAVGRVYFDGGMTDDGKLIRKAKSCRSIAENVGEDNLNKALEQLAHRLETKLVAIHDVLVSLKMK